MVTATRVGEEHAVRWLGYLTAAFIAFFAMATSINLSKPLPPQEPPRILKISLRTLAAPKKPVEDKRPPLPAVSPKIAPSSAFVSKPEAAKKIAPPPIRHPKNISPKSAPTPVVHKQVVEPEPKKFISRRKPEPPVRKPKIVKLAKVEPEKKAPSVPVKEQLAIEKDRPSEQSSLQLSSSFKAGAGVSSVVHKARYRKQKPPVYPRRSLELGQQGLVTIHAEILPNGIPSRLKIVQSSGHRRLDMAALSAVKKWEFDPGPNSQSSEPIWMRVPVRFVIK